MQINLSGASSPIPSVVALCCKLLWLDDPRTTARTVRERIAAMTLAAVWKAGEFVYAAADSRISHAHGVLTEYGPKLLPIHVICRTDTRVTYATTIGFAYAGSTLTALATQALANTFLQNLLAPEGTAPPGLHDVVPAIAQIGIRYMHEIGGVSGGGALFSAIVFGYCAQSQRFRAFRLVPRLGGTELGIDWFDDDLYAEHALIVIGNRPELLRERVQTDRPNFYAGVTDPKLLELRETDLPRRALAALIREGVDDSIGGAIQGAVVTRIGFRPQSQVVVIDPPEPSGRNAAASVLGYDLMRFPNVGGYAIGVDGR